MLLAQFIQITACNPARARTALSASEWNLDRAISAHFSNEKSNPNARTHAQRDYDTDHVRAALPSKRLRLADNFQRTTRVNYSRAQMSVQPFRNYSAEARVRHSTAGWPPAARRMHQATSSKRTNLSNLFARPHKILFKSLSFDEAKQYARAQNKWLLVNIQSNKDFDSHKLNRDTWSDETVQEIIQENCVFWQIECTAGDGPLFCSLYNVRNQSIPNIAFIDPMTGERIVSMSGFIEPEAFASKLIEFLERRESPSINTKPTKTAAAATTTAVAAVTDLTTLDSDVERAIALSIADSKGAEVGSGIDPDPHIKPPKTKHPEGWPDKVPLEPTADDVDSLKLRVRFPSGKNIIRRFRSVETVGCLFAFVAQVLQDDAGDAAVVKSFDVLVPYPRKSLRPMMQRTFEESSLSNAQVLVKFTEG